MSQIDYQEALDPYHAAFRFLRLRDLATIGSGLPVDHVRILDFYLVFPFRLKEFKFRREHIPFRKALKPYDGSEPYGFLPDDRSLLTRMQPMQMAALSTLARRELLDRASLERGIVVRTNADLSPELAARITTLKAEHPTLVEVLAALMSEYETIGSDGIKARSKLLEHRYDTAV